MTCRLQKGNYVRLVALVALVSSSLTVFGQNPKSEDTSNRQYWVDVALFSLKPGEELATYSGGATGGTTPNGTYGTGIANQSRQFDLSVTGMLKAQRFVAVVEVTPDKKDAHTQAQEIEYDLTDMKPRSVEIARDDDGRVYRLNLTPRIKIYPKPKQFSVRDLQLEGWSFLPTSPVILNDQDHIGELSMGAGLPLASCDIPGVAKIEFSLLHLKDSLPLGTLNDGVINIAHKSGTTIRILNVKNGVNEEVLAGGPYQVWVRWNKPTQSIEEYRKTMKDVIAGLKERVKNGESLPAGSLERLEKQSESDRIHIMEFAGRQIEPDDLVEATK